MTDIDHRSAQSPVRDQETRKACTAFAVAGAHEWMAGCDVRSIEDVLWAAHQVGADPGFEQVSVGNALTGVTSHGHASEPAWPFNAPAWPADRPAAAGEPDNQAMLPGWHAMSDLSVDNIEGELLKANAVILTVAVLYPAWIAAAQTGAINPPATTKINGYHAVVGVGTSSSTQRYVIFKNSWGDQWGDHGYGYLSESYLDLYLSEAHVLEAANA